MSYWKKRQDPIQFPITSEEANARNKDIVVKELLKEHKRAEDLVKRINELNASIGILTTEVKTQPASQQESETQAKERLEKVVKKLAQTISEIKIIEEKSNEEKSNEREPKNEANTSIIVKEDETDEEFHKVRTFKLDPNTKVFSGSPGERLSQWLFIINEAFTTINVKSDAMKLSLVTNYLRNGALNCLIRYKSEPNPSWVGFQKLLRDQYEDSGLDYRLRSQFFHLKMENNFPKYLQKFQELLNQMPSLTENNTEVLFKFIDGLSANYQFACRREKCETLNEAIECCQTLDSINKDYHDHGKNETINYIKTNYSRGPNGAKRSLGKRPTYMSMRLDRKPFKKFEVRKNFTPKTYKKNFIKSGEKQKTDLSKIVCLKCKKTGHYANRCLMKQNKVYTINIQPNNSRTIDNSLLNVSGTLNGIPTIFTLDTAASTCILSEKFAKENNLEILESDTKVKVANNDVVKVLGRTSKLKIEVKNHTCDLEMFVLPHNEFECLLGLQWFLATGCSVNPSERTLQFKSENFSIDDNDDSFDDHEEHAFLTDIDTAELEDMDFFENWNRNGFDGIKPSCELSKKEMILVDALSEKIKNGFAKEFSDLGKCNILPCKINLISDEIVKVPNYRKSIVEHAIIEKEVEKMLKAGIISQSNSPYQSPTLLVPKKNGEKRFVIDFRSLNARTKPENLPVANMRDIFDRISGAKWFTLCDMTQSYWQITLHKESREFTAFCTRTNKYHFNVMPYGIRNGVMHFSRIMEIAVGHLSYCCLHYVDDLVIFSKDINQHCLDIENVFKALAKVNLKVNASKCVFFAQELKLLGYIISQKELKMDPSKIEAIDKLLPPKCMKDVQIFLGVTGIYRSNIPDYAKIAKPLYDLLKKDVKFEWTLEHQEAFELLKIKLKTYPILRLPNLELPFIVSTDCSGWAIGACLSQIDPETKKEYVVSYASRLLKDTERFYSVAERELLAILYSLNLWRVYLCNKFKIITDAKALTFLMTHKSPNARLIRWMIAIQAFDFDIVYRKGSENKCADFLSRPVREQLEKKTQEVFAIQVIEENEEDEINSRKIDAYDDDSLLHFLKFGRHLVGISQKQKRRIEKIKNHYKLNDKLWYRKDTSNEKWVFYPPKEMRNDLIISCHNIGHFGANATLQRVRERYFWKNMTTQVEATIKRCATCQRQARVPSISHPAIAIEFNSIFDNFLCDLSFGFPKTEEGYHGVLVVICRLSKFPFAWPIKSKNAHEIAEKFIELICLTSPFREIQHDRGKEFMNSVLEQLLNSVGIDRRVSSAYSPKSQGLVEKFNCSLADMLRKIAEANPTKWDKFLPFALFAYRTKIHESTKMTPFSLVFGRNPNNFEDFTCKQSNYEINEIYNRTLEIKKLFEETIPKAKENVSSETKSYSK